MHQPCDNTENAGDPSDPQYFRIEDSDQVTISIHPRKEGEVEVEIHTRKGDQMWNVWFLAKKEIYPRMGHIEPIVVYKFKKTRRTPDDK